MTAKMIPSIDSLVKEVWCIIRIDRMGVKMIRDCNHHSSNLLSHKVGYIGMGIGEVTSILLHIGFRGQEAVCSRWRDIYLQ